MLRNAFRTAFRNLKRHAVNNLISVMGLAVGMVSCMLLVLYISDEAGYDRFHEHADRVFRVVTDVINNKETTDRSAYSFTAFGPSAVSGLPGVEASTRIGVSWASSFIRAGDKQFDGERLLVADSTIFDLFTYRFIEGTPKAALNRPNTIVLTASAAKRYFGEEYPVGQTINREGSQDFEVTAIVEDPPSNSHIQFDALASFETLNAQRGDFFETNWRILYGYTYIKLTGEGVAEQVEARFPSLVAPHLQATQERWGSSFQFRLQPLAGIHLTSNRDNEIEPGGSISRLYLLGAIAALMMLIACINFISLSTAQGAERASEVGVRKVLGASRTQLIQQFMTESVLIAFLAFSVAILLLIVCLPLFNQLAGKDFGWSVMWRHFAPVLFISIACLTGLLGGGYVAVVLSGLRPASALKGPGRHGKGSVFVRKCLVVAQFGAVIVLMIGAIVIQKQLSYMENAELGFEDDQVIVLGEIFAGSPVSRWDEMRSIKQELLRNSLVEGVSLASEWPTRPVQGEISLRSSVNAVREGTQIAWYQIEEDYLEMLGMELLYGRNFSSEMASDSASVLINQEAAKRLGLAEHEAVGTQILGPDSEREIATIIGVVKDFHTKSLQYAVEPVSFFNTWARPRNILVKISGQDVAGALSQIEDTWARQMPGNPLRYDFLDQEYAALYQSDVRLSRLAGIFAGLAVIIACMGLWSLASFSTIQRTKEVGVRKVLGASVSSIVVLLSKDYVHLVGLSFLLSVPIAYFAMYRWLQGYAYRIDLSIWMLVAVGVAVLVLTVATVSYQSIKASLADPIKCIRYE